MNALYVAGFGCRRGCGENALRELLEHSLREFALDCSQVNCIATIDSKRDEPGLLALAAALELPLHLFSAAQLAAFEARLSNRSQYALAATGMAGVAEAAALAQAESMLAQWAASERRAELIIEKRKSSEATFALARIFLPADTRISKS